MPEDEREQSRDTNATELFPAGTYLELLILTTLRYTASSLNFVLPV